MGGCQNPPFSKLRVIGSIPARLPTQSRKPKHGLNWRVVYSDVAAAAHLGPQNSTEGLLSAVESGLGVTFVSHWAVRNQLALGTLKLARVRGLQLSRMFSIAYAAGPEPTGNASSFRAFLLARALELMPRMTREGLKRRRT